MRKLWILFALVVVHGSLYPFDFEPALVDADTLRELLSSCCGLTSRGDIVGNMALFAPYGFFGILATERRSPAGRRLLWVSLTGAALALALQLAQLYLPSRDANLQDVFWNLLGIMSLSLIHI